jgi:hypothetical protein
MRTPVIVDTNVLWVANGNSSFSPSCVLECASELREIIESGRVVLDYGYEILTEYGRIQQPTGQPGLGFQFWKWLLNTKGSADHCEWVRITKSETRGYIEFPPHNDLRDFDLADRKFVAVAVAHSGSPSILQAADSKWWGWQTALTECGIAVRFLCAQEVQANFHLKIGGGRATVKARMATRS